MTSHHFPSDREIVITRRVAAPRARVFSAFTAPNVDAWWGPDGFVTTTERRDCRAGGEWIFTMAHPEHGSFPNRIRYVEITEPERLVYDHDGGEGSPRAFRTIISFEAAGDDTLVSLHTIFPTAEACTNAKNFHAVAGGYQTLARFAHSLGLTEAA